MLSSYFALVVSLMVVVPVILIFGTGWVYYCYYHELRYKDEIKQLREWVRHDRGGIHILVNEKLPQFRQDVLEYQDSELDFDHVYDGGDEKGGKLRTSESKYVNGNDMNKFENPLRRGMKNT